jgi:hypothetical protein
VFRKLAEGSDGGCSILPGNQTPFAYQEIEGVATETRTMKKLITLSPAVADTSASSQHNNQSILEDIMKSNGCYTGFVARPSIRYRRWSQPLGAIAITLLLLLPIAGTPANAATSASPAPGAHVYLLRGVLNIFSLGLDGIADKLQRQGINATVANYLSWESLAQEAATEYRSGQIKTVVLVGHSSGATVLPYMVARLNQLGVPVKLAVGLDSVFHTSLSGQVGRYVNFYVANGAGTVVQRTGQFRGTLENVDVGSLGVGHLSIDKSEVMQQKVISEIDAVVFSRARGTPAVHKRPALDESRQSSAAPVTAAPTRQ